MIERWADKVDLSGGPGGCTMWTGAVVTSGYGAIREPGKGRTLRAHRVSHELFNGPIPSHLEVRHTCDNRRCVNPNHLILGTHSENMIDMVLRGRGHPPRLAVANGSRLNPDRVRLVRELRRGGATYPQIANVFGVSEGCVEEALQRRTWKHVP